MRQSVLNRRRSVWRERAPVRRFGGRDEQRCDLESFTEVARLIDERGSRGLTTNEMWESLPEVPQTRASVALDFLKERGVICIEGRRCYPTSTAPFEYALSEWHALDQGDES